MEIRKIKVSDMFFQMGHPMKWYAEIYSFNIDLERLWIRV